MTVDPSQVAPDLNKPEAPEAMGATPPPAPSPVVTPPPAAAPVVDDAPAPKPLKDGTGTAIGIGSSCCGDPQKCGIENMAGCEVAA